MRHVSRIRIQNIRDCIQLTFVEHTHTHTMLPECRLHFNLTFLIILIVVVNFSEGGQDHPHFHSTVPKRRDYYFRKNWPDGIVTYEIAPDFSNVQQKSLEKAMKDIERSTCVQFKRRKDEREYLMIEMNHGNGCSTDTDLHRGNQEMSLDPDWCLQHGRILHELMHSLGFTHEHQRPDRDDYIKIFWNNIYPNQKAQFRKKDFPLSSTFGFPYDLSSILHYANWSLYAAIDTSQPIIMPLTSEPNMGQRIGLNQMDVDKVNLFYKCKI